MPSSLNNVNPQEGPVEQSPTLESFTKRNTTLIALVLFGIATTGYFLGLTSPMTAKSEQPSAAQVALHSGTHDEVPENVIPATTYSEMSEVTRRTARQRSDQLATLRQVSFDPSVIIKVDEAEKLISLAHRETRRSFNGAPPTVPHTIDQLDSAACMACHGKGLLSQSLRAGKMPHPYYSACTQCHVEQQAKFTLASLTFENSFVGAKAPRSGKRAYPGAPPAVPHSTWMRNDCLSCHGATAAKGMESTHPWRRNCLQCHTESSKLNQTKLGSTPNFLPAPTIVDSNE